MAYRADIEIAVKGAQELKRLTDQISATSKLVNSLNNYLENIGTGGVVRNINNLQQAVSKAAAAFNDVALGTQEATLAAKNYIIATQNLNSGLEERLALIRQVTEAERKQRLAAAGVRETTQYAGPIGPGAASSVALSTPLRGRTQQILDERAGRAQLNAVLQDQFEKERQLSNSKLDIKALQVQAALDAQATAASETAAQLAKLSARQEDFINRTDAAAQAARRQTAEFLRQERLNRQARTQYAGPIGPGAASPVALQSQLRGRTDQILKLEKASVEASNAVFNLALQQEQALDKAKRANQDKIFQEKLKQLDTLAAEELALNKQVNDKALKDFDARLNANVNKRARMKEATSNAIIGGAFPLLFGQGIGASVGGGLGGAVGGALGGQLGFGLSLVGTALGSVFDQAVLSAQDFAKSLRAGGDAATYLEQRLGSVNTEVKLQISNLQQSGQTSAAANKAFNELARQIGTENAQAFRTLGDETLNFSTGFQRLVTILIAGSTRINQALAPLLDRLIPGLEGIKTFIGGISNFAPQRSQTDVTPEFAARTAELARQNTILGLQVTLTSVSAANDLERFVTIQKQIATKEYENELTKIAIQLKTGEINIEQNKLKITAANLDLTKKLGDIERTRIEELARRQQQAAQAAEEAQRKAEASLKARMNTQKSILEEQMKLIDINIRQQEFTGGEEVGLQRSLDLINARARLSVKILENERNTALQEAVQTGTVAEVVRLYDTKLRNAEYELNLQRVITQARLNQLKVEKQLAAARREQGIEDVAIPIQRRQEDVRLGIAGFGQSEQLIEQQRLALEQRRRLEDGELPILREIAALQTEINGGGLAADALAAKEADLDASQRKLGVLREELTLLDQLEQRQLRLQQFFASYGQLIQSVSGEIANAVTFGVSEMVRGTKTAEQVFADFLNAVGNALMQAAQTMIAQYIAIGIAKIFAGLGGGGLGSMGGGGGFGSFSGGSIGVGGMSLPGLEGAGALASASPFSYAGVVMRAGGGPAVGGTPYLVGERGPELFVPGTSGGVMSNNDLRQSMNGGGSPVLNMSFETTRFGDTEYVSRDQLEAAMSETRRQASRDGAQRGMTMTLDRLQQSPRTRSRLGMR